MPRSEPPQPKKVRDKVAEQATRDEEELAYYFMPWRLLDIFRLTLFHSSTDKLLLTVYQLVLACDFIFCCIWTFQIQCEVENPRTDVKSRIEIRWVIVICEVSLLRMLEA